MSLQAAHCTLVRTSGPPTSSRGRKNPIVIYSMTTSSHADAPREMEFLYSANRLNVATSRAKCLCILVAAPAVFEAECRTPGQMQLAKPRHLVQVPAFTGAQGWQRGRAHQARFIRPRVDNVTLRRTAVLDLGEPIA
jgi:hypothetical protein